jgi:hypothetical protein
VRRPSAAAAAAVALTAALAGCGERVPDIGEPRAVVAPAQTAGPGPTSERAALVARLRRLRPGSAAPGAVVVVDVTGRDLTAAPRRIQFAKDGTLEGLRWTGWGAPEAVGRGMVSLLECQPSCARGVRRGAVAEIRLTRLRDCGGRRFYDAAEVRFGVGAQRSFARAFIGAPC